MTRNPEEHDFDMECQSEKVITEFEYMGIQVLLCVGNHHRKLAILDKNPLGRQFEHLISDAQS